MGSYTTVVTKPKKQHGMKKSKKERQRGHHLATGKYLKQKKRTAKNKERDWNKHLTKNPNDLQAKEAIKELRKVG